MVRVAAGGDPDPEGARTDAHNSASHLQGVYHRDRAMRIRGRWLAACVVAPSAEVVRERDAVLPQAQLPGSRTVSSVGCVLLKISDPLTGRPRTVVACADELLRCGRDLVRIHLITEQQQQIRPARRQLPHQPTGQGRTARRSPAPDESSRRGREYGASGGAVTLQDPNATRVSASRASVRMTLGGNCEPGSGQRRSPSNATSYSRTEPGSSPSITTIA
jgi:hypothetical protein